MIWLILSILSSASLLLFFKMFEKYKVDTFTAIVINYFVCVLVGLPLVQNFEINTSSGSGWIFLAILLGCMFISLFFLIGVTTQKMGVSVATISMKLGYIFPIIIAFTIYNETINPVKIIGIALTLLAVIFTSIKNKKTAPEVSAGLVLFPVIIFLGSGICDSIVQYTEKVYFSKGGFEIFSILIFGTAFLIGFLVVLFNNFKKGINTFNKKNIIAGALLGVPNYFSIYFLFKALNVDAYESSVVFPINNIGIVLTSTLLAIILFKEKLSPLNQVGFVFAILSIVLMAPSITNFILNLF